MAIGQKLRIGVVSYLNAVPLWYSLQNDESVEVIPDTPARLCEMMDAGQIDVGLLPVVETLRHPTWTFFNDLGVAADGTVDSVGLFTREELNAIKTVALTSASRTSITLAKIILGHAGATPEYVPVDVTADDLAGREEDAVLLIGDQCLRARNLETDRVFVDLAAEWKLLSGLPFVFAVWSGPKDKLDEELHARLQRAHEESRALSHDLIRYAGMDTGWSEADLANYLDNIIIHELSEDCLKGLLEFTRRAAAMELVPKEAVDKVLDVMRGDKPS
ncbi:MAG: menaquinone biosynthesis protein [Planctomycetes bacterium]|nr:menaquinone biosynthesis protein [Planctomycetota bacterium]